MVRKWFNISSLDELYRIREIVRYEETNCTGIPGQYAPLYIFPHNCPVGEIHIDDRVIVIDGTKGNDWPDLYRELDEIEEELRLKMDTETT